MHFVSHTLFPLIALSIVLWRTFQGVNLVQHSFPTHPLSSSPCGFTLVIMAYTRILGMLKPWTSWILSHMLDQTQLGYHPEAGPETSDMAILLSHPMCHMASWAWMSEWCLIKSSLKFWSFCQLLFLTLVAIFPFPSTDCLCIVGYLKSECLIGYGLMVLMGHMQFFGQIFYLNYYH